MTDVVQRGLVILQAAFNRTVAEEKAGLHQERCLSNTGSNLGFNKPTSKAEIVNALPRLLDAYGINSGDLDDVKREMHATRQRQEVERAAYHAEAKATQAEARLPENYIPRRWTGRHAYPQSLDDTVKTYSLKDFERVRSLALGKSLDQLLFHDEEIKSGFLSWLNSVIDSKRKA